MNIALFGNPNTGKTSLFNMITGSYEYVGNWTGVTVEKKVGLLKNKQDHLIDLPGIYSLNPISKDEGVATEFLLRENFTSIINIVDASQLERNLYLTVQLLEYGKPLLVGLNMMDVAKGRGIHIDHEQLAHKLGIAMIPIVARSGKNCEHLIHSLGGLDQTSSTCLQLSYGTVLENAIKQIEEMIPKELDLPKRWLALQYLEGNEPITRRLLQQQMDSTGLHAIREETEQRVKEMNSVHSLQQFIRQIRTQFITDILKDTVTRTKETRTTLTDRIDLLLTHRILGMPLFLLFMYLIFKLTFDWVGTPLSDKLDAFLAGPLTNGIQTVLEQLEAADFIRAVILNGIVSGVGGVLVFIPQITILFFLISFIEDSGYMARVAMVMDRIMERIGLNGKAFIPMIIGFGCNVPGVMAARTIEQPKERLVTILLTPLMSCSARLPVYSLFVGAFFATRQALVVLGLYVLGIVVALLLAKLFSSTILKQDQSIFLIELPPYRFPQLRTLMRSTWEKGKGFLRKAGTIIFGGSVAIWFLSYAGPSGLDVDMNESFLAMIGGGIAPLFAPIGFGNWQAGASLLTGFIAKEVVVATMNIIYAAPDVESLQGMMSQFFTPMQSLSFMTFILLYVPCLATVAAIRKETVSVKWTWFSIGYALVVAYIISFLVYRGGRLLGFE